MSKIQLSLSQDNNTLDQVFYHELLHIMGLIEVKDGGKKLIQRKKTGDRYSGSLLENAIAQLDSLDKISRLENPEDFGANYQDQLFNIGLDLVITWVNRILFIKLLEAQLINYNQGNKNYSILNLDKIKDFDDLNSLFFMVLARKNSDRSEKIQQIFNHVPYLNSSLFEPTELEHEMIFISNLQGENLPIFAGTVLKDHQGKKRTGTINILQYLFEFLNAYNFSSDKKSTIQEDNKRLINASVLGLIFEKINGYQDGSFFTPGFITMYMCRETIRKAIIQKFNEVKGWSCQNLDDLYDKIDDKKEANTIINSLKICDPAVGSGHFLVSALNEIIAVKSQLKILLDRNGKTLRDYEITVENDELIIIDDNGKLFEYNPKNTESQKVQENLFHEKQTIIENCLFGVDINPNSVKICRLRLWIELLKNAYYKQDTTQKPGFSEKPGFYPEMETLPNIDIKIKCGNSLISRFPLSGEVMFSGKVIQQILTYKNAVKTYFNTQDKNEKRQIERYLRIINESFLTEFGETDSKKIKLRILEGELFELEHPNLLFEETVKEKKAKEKKISKLQNEIDKLKVEIEERDTGKIYQNAFEWRYQFPEVLNDRGEFIGFDVIIGNPPYINAKELTEKQPFFRKYMSDNSKSQYFTLYQKWDIYIAFIEQSLNLTNNGICSFIIPYPYLNQTYAKLSKELLVTKNTLLEIVDLSNIKVFDEAVVNNCIIFYQKQINDIYQIEISKFINEQFVKLHQIKNQEILNNNAVIDLEKRQILKFDNDQIKPLGDLCFLSVGMVLNADEKKAKGAFIKDDLISDKKSVIYCRKYIEAKNIDRYQINIIRFLEWNTTRVPHLIRRPTFKELYENEKIIINKIGKIKATYDDNHLFCDQTIRIAILWHDLSKVENRSINNSVAKFSNYSRKELEKFSKQINLKFILAILNSSLGNYLIDNIRGVGNIDLNPEYLKNIPIPYINIEEQQPLINLVEQILEMKKSNPQTDTTELEREIDQLVYQLYGLTETEIKLVEGG
jgi:adenine-specific DNA-methyltransferase